MNKNQYSLKNDIIAIIELVCSVVALFLLFVPWLSMSVPWLSGSKSDFMTPFELIKGTPLLFIFLAAVIGNIVLKFFKRSVWLSVIVAFLVGQQILIYNDGIEQFNNDYGQINYDINVTVWGVLSVLLELVLVGCIFGSIIEWLTMFSRKTAKKLLYAAAASFGFLILCMFLMIFLRDYLAFLHDYPIPCIVTIMIGLLVFVICGSSGAIIWFMGKKDNKECTDVTTSQEGLTEAIPAEDTLVDNNANSSRKWYYIGGGIAVLAVIIGVFTCLGQRHEFAGKPISELFPEAEKEADAGNIPDEPLTFTWDNSQGEECDGDVTIVRKADENQLVIMYSTTSCDANTLYLGNYQNGQYVFYYEIPVGGIDYDETTTGISLKNNAPENFIYYGTFGKDVAKTVEYDWGTETSVDWDKVTEAQLAEIFAAAIAEGPKEPIVITAKSIKAAKEGNNSEEEIEYESITTDLDQFQELIERTHDVVAECERNSESIDDTIYNNVRNALESLNDNMPLMSDAQRERFNILSQQANELMEYADRVSAEAVDTVAAIVVADTI